MEELKPSSSSTGLPQSGEFPHVVRSGTLRKGQRCKILRQRGFEVQVQFADGTTEVYDRRSLRRSDATAHPERTPPHVP